MGYGATTIEVRGNIILDRLVADAVIEHISKPVDDSHRLWKRQQFLNCVMDYLSLGYGAVGAVSQVLVDNGFSVNYEERPDFDIVTDFHGEFPDWWDEWWAALGAALPDGDITWFFRDDDDDMWAECIRPGVGHSTRGASLKIEVDA